MAQRRHSQRIASLLSSLVAASAWGWSVVGLGQPTVTAVAPGAIARGATTELTLRDSGLDGQLSIWASFPGTLEWHVVTT